MLLVPEKTSFTPPHAESRYPYMFDQHDGQAEISVVFTWHKKKAEDMAQAWKDWGWSVSVGGPAYDDPAGEFCPGKYVKHGVVITHRGCLRGCPWCYVPKREGKIRCLDVKPGNILQDNNILACPRFHQRKVFLMLRNQKNVRLVGGIDCRLITDYAIEEIRSLDLEEVWVAYDSRDNRSSVARCVSLLRKAGIPQRKIRCYVMVGFNETVDQAEERCVDAFLMGTYPFAQVFDQISGQELNEFKRLARKWSRPAAYKAFMKGRKYDR